MKFINAVRPTIESANDPRPVRTGGSLPAVANAPIVGVVDSGCDFNHDALKPFLWRNPREISNGKDDDKNSYIDDVRGYNFAANNANPMDDDGHGTHVCGIVAQAGCKVMAVKSLQNNSAQEAWVSRGILYAARKGARVISLSLGGYYPSPKIAAAVKWCIDNGCIVVAAAGNDGLDIRREPIYPACLPGVLSVGALDGSKLWSASNTGARICAQGKAVYSTLPGNRWGRYSGTSMATPHVSAACALVWGRRPQWTAFQVIDHVLRTTDTIANVGRRLNISAALADL